MVTVGELNITVGVIQAPNLSRVEPEMCRTLGAKVNRVLVLLAGEETRGFARRAVTRTVIPQGDRVVFLNNDITLIIGVCSRSIFVGRGVGKRRVVGDRSKIGFKEVDVGEVVVLGVGATEADHDLKN